MISGVCVLGDPAVDLIVRLPEIKNGKKVMLNAPNLHPGGSGANMAVALARLGVNTQFIGTVGEDRYGRVVVDDFVKENVGIDQLFIEPALSTVCVFAFIDQDGERYLWGWPQDNQSYTAIEFTRINLERIRQTGWLHTTGLLLAKESSGRYTTLDILDWSMKNGVVTSFDLNLRSSAKVFKKTYYEVVMRAIDNSKYIMGSEHEFSLLHKSHNWEKSAEYLESKNKNIIVRRGELGSIYFTQGKRLKSTAFHVKVVDTVGAGDVFNAGFIAALLNQQDDQTALQWGNAVAGYTISMEGARASPTLKQLRKFIKEQG